MSERGARNGMPRRIPAPTLAPLLAHPTQSCPLCVRPYHYRPPRIPSLPLSPTCLPIIAMIGVSSSVDCPGGFPRRLPLHHDSFAHGWRSPLCTHPAFPHASLPPPPSPQPWTPAKHDPVHSYRRAYDRCSRPTPMIIQVLGLDCFRQRGAWRWVD